jgi:class 3 adenylate cyclase
LRIGIHCGPAVAGVIGTSKPSYDVWGDTINIASRLESHGLPDRIQVSGRVRERLEGDLLFEARGEINVKGRGLMQTHFLTGRR